MRIIYANNNLKEKCRNPIRRKIYNIDVERILKLLNMILGRKATILEYFGNYDKRTISLKVQTEEGLIENIEMTTLPNKLDTHFRTLDYLIVVRELELDESIEKRTYRISKQDVKCIGIDSYNKSSGITIRYATNNPNITNFVITKENLKCSFAINDSDNIEEIISRLSTLENLDSDTIYNLLNENSPLRTTNNEETASARRQFVKRIDGYPVP